MADVKNPDTNDEPSMEEILASIRRIIADEKTPEEDAPAETPAEPVEDDVIELTQAVEEDGKITDLSASEPVPPPPVAPRKVEEPPQMDDNLVSDTAATAAISSMESLARSAHVEPRPVPTSYTPIGASGRTLEDMVLELMRPMLKGWLDDNLPPIVERIVQKEVERIARRVQE